MATMVLQAAVQVASQAAISYTMGADGPTRHREGARLEELSVQTSTYGNFIPVVYGNVRIAGNVIWSQPIKEIATTTTVTQGKGGGGATSSTTEYSYFVTLAIAICEGEVERIERVWADAKQLDLGLGSYRFYKGDESQLPDPVIESYEGVGSTPAYRGLSYVVIEDFPLAEYGNRIPNFTFEVRKKALWPDVDDEPVESLIKEMVLIPGSGEFVYDTAVQHKQNGSDINGNFAQAGEQVRINQHTPFDKANALVALDQLEDTCPNLEWVALVVNWFGTSMTLTDCEVLPGVEFAQDTGRTTPESWTVGGYNRQNAHPITWVDDTPRYGGTPDDQSVLRLCDELQARGKKILFLPLFLMDTENKPWRGRLTGAAADVAHFFIKPGGYNDYVLHYANLLKDKVDAFAIGSEMRGLTEVHDGATQSRQFPAVDALIALAGSVKTILGSGVKVTYAADWSEYHHTTDGWYHMDPLWASASIDVIGIDAYFPLTDAAQGEIGYDPLTIQQGWTSGEGYDFYYSDAARTVKQPLAAPYAWKNLDWFWSNSHTNPDGSQTAWVAESKPIWFTEYGFPSVDAATNQPNVFHDPSSSESFFPYQSQGRVDFRAQRAGIAATLAQWKNSPMVEKTFLWTWDARPYPYWPDLMHIWADGGVWITGHWVQGKLGLSSLAAIVADLSQKAGLALTDINVAQLNKLVDGFVIKQQRTARQLIETLMAAYFFDAAESDGTIRFIMRGAESAASLNTTDCVLSEAENDGFTLRRQQELELPERVEVNYLNRLQHYQTGTQRAMRQLVDARSAHVMDLPIVMNDQEAKHIADTALYESWLARAQYQWQLPIAYSDLEPADILTITDLDGAEHRIRITQTRSGAPGKIELSGVADAAASYDIYTPAAPAPAPPPLAGPVPDTRLHLLDLPALPGDGAQAAYLRLAGAGVAASWPGAVVYRSDDGGENYSEMSRLTQVASFGTVWQALPDGPRNRFDEAASLDVVLYGAGQLESHTELALLNGANLMLVGEELIQFAKAEETSPNRYRISRLLRGRFGTEQAMSTHTPGEPCFLLNHAVKKIAIPEELQQLPRLYKAVSIGKTLGSVTAQSFIYQAKALRPYAPVHLSSSRDGSGNISLHWVRRTRIGGNWRDGGDVPLSETREAYEVEVLDGADIVRTLSVTEPMASYSAAQQVADFGALQSAITVRIMQLSDQVGRGYAAMATL